MAISDTQKVDLLFKKIGYGVAKTDVATSKSPANETVSSPLLLRGENLWTQSDSISNVGTLPSANVLVNGSTVVAIYRDSLTTAQQTTNDATAGTNRTWKTGLTNWIGPEFGSGYAVKVYTGASLTASTASTGTALPVDGSGNNDSWYFDYQSGVLNFADTNVPSSIAAQVWVVGARYTGSVGIATLPSLTLTGNLTSTNGNIVLTNGNITAANYYGTFQGTAATANSASYTTITPLTNNQTYYVQFGNVTSGSSVTGGATAVNVNPSTGSIFSTSANVTTINAGGTVDIAGITRLTNSQTATSSSTGALVVTGGVGIGANLWVGGWSTLSGNVTIGGNLTVSGNSVSIGASTLSIVDPIISLNTPADLSPLTVVTTSDIGIKFHYYDTSDQHAFLGRAVDTGYLEWYSRGNDTANVFTGTVYGTIKPGALVLANAKTVGGGLTANTGALQVWGDGSINGNLFVGGTFTTASINATPIGNATPSTGAFTTLSASGASTLNTVTGASFQGIIGNVTPSTGAFVGVQATAIGNVTPGTGVFTTGTFNTATTGGLQAVAIGNATPGTGAFTTLTGGSFQGIIGNATATTGFFTTATATTVNAATVGNIGANVVGTGTYLTSLTGSNVNGTVATANVSLYNNITPYTTNQTFYLQFANVTNGNTSTGAVTTVNVNPSTGNVYANAFVGSGLYLTGVATAGAGNVSFYQQLTNSTTNASFYIPFYDKATGNASAYTNTALSFRPSDGYFFATVACVGTIMGTTINADTTITASGAIRAFSGVASTSTSTGALQVQGGAGVTGVVNIGGNLVLSSGTAADPATNYTGALVVTGTGGIFAGGNINLDGQGFFGPGTHLTGLANAPLVATGSANSYVQVSVQNNSTGTSASSDFVATADTGTDSTKYIDVGINNSGFTTGGAWTMSGALDGYMYVNSGNLTLGTDTLGKTVSIHTGGTFANNIVMTFNANNVQPTSAATGAVVIPSGGLGVSGNVFHGNATIMNSSQTAGADTIVRGKNDATLLWARPNATYDTVIIGNSATASTVVNGAKLAINTTDSILLPVGTSAQRPGSQGYTDTTGMFRFSSTVGAIEWYNGTSWQSASTQFTVIADQQFTGTGSQTAFTLSSTQTTASCIVSINGVVQIPTLAYSVTSTTLTFTEAPANGEVIDVRMLTTTSTVAQLYDTSGYNTVNTVTGTGITFTTGSSALTTQYTIDTRGAMVTNGSNVTVASAGTSTIDTLFANTYSSAKYTITATMSGTNIREINEVLMIHNGDATSAGTATVLSYGKINTAGNTLVTFGATTTGNIAQLQATTTNANTILRIQRDYLAL